MNQELKEVLESISKRLTALEAIQEKKTVEQNVRQPVNDRDASDSEIVNEDNSRVGLIMASPLNLLI